MSCLNKRLNKCKTNIFSKHQFAWRAGSKILADRNRPAIGHIVWYGYE